MKHPLQHDLFQEDPSRRPPSRWRRQLIATGVALVTAACVGGCNTFTTYLVDREDRRVPREADGVMVGASAYDLGEPNRENAVLFVHGFAGAANNFNELPRLLAERGWYVRVIRLPGHGTSPRDLESTTADVLIRAVLEEATRLTDRYKRVVLVGHSMGGALCTIAASKTPVDGLVLGGACFGVTDRWYYGLKPERWTELSSHVIRWVYKGRLFLQVNDRSAKPKIVAYTWLPTKAGVTLNKIVAQANNSEVLGAVACPVLAFHSHGDVAASPEALEQALASMKSDSKKLVWVDRSNHHVFWDFDLETVETETLAFAEAVAQP